MLNALLLFLELLIKGLDSLAELIYLLPPFVFPFNLILEVFRFKTTELFAQRLQVMFLTVVQTFCDTQFEVRQTRLERTVEVTHLFIQGIFHLSNWYRELI
jgi:hypothetical protein